MAGGAGASRTSGARACASKSQGLLESPLSVGAFVAALAAYGVATHAEKIATLMHKLERMRIDVRFEDEKDEGRTR